ncbi:MAG: hypothetical protein AB1656_01730 [Candidatus Omnitrophota bacterium]
MRLSLQIPFHLFAIAFLSFVPSARAELPGYENAGIERLQLLTLTQNVISNGTQTVDLSPSSQELLSKGSQTWQQIFVDIAGSKVLIKYFLTEDKPVDFSLPTQISLIEKDSITFIDYLKKTVSLSKFDPISILDGSNIVWAGRAQSGRILAGIIQKASSEIQKDEKNERNALEIGAPYFRPPAFPQPLRFVLDAKLRPVSIVEKKRAFAFEWEEEKGNFSCVVRAVMETIGGPIRLRQEISVADIQIDPSFPPDLFQLSYPDDFQVGDRRKMLSPPRF